MRWQVDKEKSTGENFQIIGRFIVVVVVVVVVVILLLLVIVDTGV